MAEPIKKAAQVAPTPQNTPSSVSTLQAQTPLARSRQGMASISESNAGADSAALLDIIQSKLGTLDGLTSGYIEALPKVVKDRVAALKGLRTKQAQIEGEFHRELLELEKKYLVKQQPFYEERKKLITGSASPQSEDIEKGEAAFAEEKEMFDGDSDFDEDDDSDDEESRSQQGGDSEANKSSRDDAAEEAEAEDTSIVGIPNFWLTAFRNVPHLTEMISDRDNDVLASLVDVRLRYLDKPGFALEFEFADNSYFTNRVLTKTYYYNETIGLSGDFMFDSASGTPVKWVSPEVNVTIRVEKRKQRNKHTKATRTIEKTLPEQSFFNFFTPPKIPDPESDEVDDEYAQSLHAELELDFELGEFFKEKLVPHAVDWFTGRAIDYEGLGGPEDEEEDEEDEDEDEDGADEDGVDEDGAEGFPEGSDSLEGMKKEVPENCKQQ